MLFEFYDRISGKMLMLEAAAIALMVVSLIVTAIFNSDSLAYRIADYLFWIFFGMDFALMISSILIKRVINEILIENY
ncbi:hypothetical protein [Methanobrevibacter millerae]|uniref:Uncharacterized protein n=1 Tax=Methanobrevibacter millerae TaxID=230361 RepID=A0A1G5VKG3_9EURY|nr:hypothetical protein [Methanobrevibacter millerae]SDA46218.1 hypothetical protein SAMN02910315_00693 [Methanobrevibacter millerae]